MIMGLLDWLFVARGQAGSRRTRGADEKGQPGSRRATGVGDRRRVARFAGLGARVIIDGAEYDVGDWAENSFRVTGFHGDLIANQIIHFRFLLVYREETWEWPGVGRIIRIDSEAGEMAVVFKPPEEPFRSRLRNVTDALTEGTRLSELTAARRNGDDRT
ncbi:hypothetical protein KAJ83_01050 [Marivibrio halodurans]|uniref:PilZ domain-containing protein n=1 Tax=Marivibrio halodurans TaxID=2039722 RepID=A0A8J7S2N0_9PROT|nr:hypothetical protein [Marivibrio halodurans]MBP5855579.1 hypothetical protein [Marivibrio halodurans]